MSKQVSVSKSNKSSKRKNALDVAIGFSLSQTLPAGNRFLPDSQLYKHVAGYETKSVLTTSTTLETFASIAFQIANIDDVSNLGGVFDQYRIDEVEIWIFPNCTSVADFAHNPGMISSVIDYDDSSNLGTVISANAYDNCLTVPGTMGMYRRFKPHAAMALYAGAFSSYGNLVSPWIDAVSTTVQHYGVKLASTSTTSVTGFNANVRIHSTWKAQR